MRKAIIFTALLTAACGGSPANNGTDGGAGQIAIITTSDSTAMTGSINTVDVNTKVAHTSLDTTLDSDTAIRVLGNKAYIVNRTHGTVRVYDATTFAAPNEYTAGDTTHSAPMGELQDAMPIPNSPKVFVTLQENVAANALGVIDTTTSSGNVTTWIPLTTATADIDGNPEAGAMYYCNGKLYVALLDLNESTFSPTGAGRLAVVDVASNTVTSTIQLARQNPAGFSSPGADCSTVYVAESGPLNAAPDDTLGGIEQINLTTGASSGLIAHPSVLGGAPSSIEIVSAQLAYSIVFFNLQTSGGFTELESAKVVAFNPTTGAYIRDASGTAGFIPFARASASGELFIGVFTSATTGNLAGGLYVGPADGTNITTGTPISLGASPYAIAFH